MQGDDLAPPDGPPTDAVDLACRYDDPADPSELTIFSPDPPKSATEWLTADRSVAVPLDRIR